jgi:hypothetical protein
MSIADYVAEKGLLSPDLDANLRNRILEALAGIDRMINGRNVGQTAPLKPKTDVVSEALSKMYLEAHSGHAGRNGIIFGHEVQENFEVSLSRELKQLFSHVFWATVNQPWSIAMDRKFNGDIVTRLKGEVMRRHPQVDQYVALTAGRNIWALVRMAVGAANLGYAAVVEAVLPLLELAPRFVPLLLNIRFGVWLTLDLA